jgi:thiamine biosynthesis lipoprotein
MIALCTALVALSLLVKRDDVRELERGEFTKFSTEFFDTFDTHVTFTAFAPDEAAFERYAKIAHDEMTRLHRLFDIYNLYDGTSNIRTINENAGVSPVVVDSSIIDLLTIARDAYGYTDGAVNVALGPVLSIWHDLRTRALSGDNEFSIPTPEALTLASTHTSVDDIVIDSESSTVFLRCKDMSLDVGALAKGYAVQKTVELLRKSGLESALINAGGNVVATGAPLDGRSAWSIGVRAPVEEEMSENMLDVLYVPSGAIVTSGNYQRFFKHDGRSYHHIIDPATLYPAEYTRAVTVLHPDSTTADILSTAAFILGYDRARALIGSLGAEALWVTADGAIIMTDGYRRISQLGKANSSQDLKQ